MSKSIKQIYVSLEIGENDLKMLVAEYFNSRFNILRVDQKLTNSLNNFKIIDKEQFVSDIKDLVLSTSDKLGAKIEEVILVLPAYQFKRFPVRSKIISENETISKIDVYNAIKDCLKAEINDNTIAIDPSIIRYTVNGISSRRIPEKEKSDDSYVDVDLLCTDKQFAIDYLSAVEDSGLKVIDITLNTYAASKEAALFEESLKQNLIYLDIHQTCTYLTLLSKGRLVSSEIIYDGLSSIVNQVRLKYDIPDENILKLIKYDVDYDSKYLDAIIYAYNETNTTKTITVSDLNEIVKIALETYLKQILDMCSPILENDSTIFVTGEGQQMKTLIDELKQRTSHEVKSYYPDTIGVRDPSLTALYGALFVYRDKVLLSNRNVACIDLLEYDSLIDQKQLDADGDTITTKIKNLFKQYVEKEGKK